jgi:D-3-phosphoglycerate dehydrogenase
VVNAPTANTVAAAEHGIALMCTLSRNVSQADASMKAGKWERNKYVGVSLVDKVLCIMGFGKVRRSCSSRVCSRRIANISLVDNNVFCLLASLRIFTPT